MTFDWDFVFRGWKFQISENIKFSRILKWQLERDNNSISGHPYSLIQTSLKSKVLFLIMLHGGVMDNNNPKSFCN